MNQTVFVKEILNREAEIDQLMQQVDNTEGTDLNAKVYWLRTEQAQCAVAHAQDLIRDEPFRKSVVEKALNGSTKEQTVQMTFGELFLFHLLLQEFSLPYVGDDRFIPLVVRNKERIDNIKEI